ncbi:hypothetical protein [[Clostridium] fimetarium]|uniref:Oxaloacetate decarboxylase, gamma chain n=1 Tax=[Clostridium] fimetarium TaxID=99656 RepID=A0A1I0RFT2_9FIRM|nr:hypothetical protein [[Clostridium] fimetarium]SEW39723.1 hypothetical protein SAMN05421659_11543 [[Clostridium] fimetarium]
MIEQLLNSERWSNFLISLNIMWKGMLAIFIVLGIISIIVMIMTKLQKDKKDKIE